MLDDKDELFLFRTSGDLPRSFLLEIEKLSNFGIWDKKLLYQIITVLHQNENNIIPELQHIFSLFDLVKLKDMKCIFLFQAPNINQRSSIPLCSQDRVTSPNLNKFIMNIQKYIKRNIPCSSHEYIEELIGRGIVFT